MIVNCFLADCRAVALSSVKSRYVLSTVPAKDNKYVSIQINTSPGLMCILIRSKPPCFQSPRGTRHGKTFDTRISVSLLPGTPSARIWPQSQHTDHCDQVWAPGVTGEPLRSHRQEKPPHACSSFVATVNGMLS